MSYSLKSFGTLHLRPFGGGSFFWFVYIALIFYIPKTVDPQNICSRKFAEAFFGSSCWVYIEGGTLRDTLAPAAGYIWRAGR